MKFVNKFLTEHLQKMKNIEDINKALVTKIVSTKKVTDFSPGDTIKVGVKIIEGKKALNKKTTGKIINLFKKEPLVIAHNTGSSREEEKPEDFSALTARSSARIPAVFLADTLVIVRTSSMRITISSRTAKKPEVI